MARLVKAVHVKDPDRSRTVLLMPGEEPEPRLAALVTNPDAWEGGQLPDVEATDGGDDGDGKAEGRDSSSAAAAAEEPDPEPEAKKAAPAAKKTAARKTAASKPAQGREAADQGDSGE